MISVLVTPKRLGRRRSSLLLAATALAGMPTLVWADQTWLGTLGSNWFTGGNWSEGTDPSADERLYIEDTGLVGMPVIEAPGAVAGQVYIGSTNNGGALGIAEGGDLTAGTVVVRGNGANLNVDATGGSATLNSGHLIVGEGGTEDVPMTNASVSITNGATANVSGQLIIGRDYSSGALLVDGEDSTLTVEDELSMGLQDGTAQLDVVQGARFVTNGLVTLGDGSGSVATMRVQGDSGWTHAGAPINVGALGSAMLTISDGASVDTTGMAIGVSAPIDADDPAGGTVMVAGENSRLTSATALRIGSFGRGYLIVSDSGLVQADGACIGCEGDSAVGEATVSDGGILDLTSGATEAGTVVGGDGNGAIIVRPGGSVYTWGLTMAAEAGAAGRVQLDGNSESFSRMTTEGLVAGAAGRADVEVGAHSALWVRDRASFGQGAGGVGMLYVGGDEAALRVNDGLIIGEAGTGVAVLGNGGDILVADLDEVQGEIKLAELAGSSGTLVIGAAEDSTATSSGTVRAAGIEFGAGNGRLIFNHDDTLYDFAVPLSGNGLVMAQSGRTRLTGASADFTGQVTAGGPDAHLLINGQLGSDADPVSGVLAEQYATLGGGGTIYGSVVVNSHARLAPGEDFGTSPGILTINGDLELSEEATLAFDLGSPGGANDRIDVAGNLVLDGALDVADAGDFGEGVYRLINYGGAIDDRGLDINLLPPGWSVDDVAVQTSVVGEVNLYVGSAPTETNFWNGDNFIPTGTVNGGSGTWTASDTNWTDMAGTSSAAYDPSRFVVFMGSPGVVTVDNSEGEVAVTGMQFATDGYIVEGDDIQLNGAANIRVGNGSLEGAAYTATIDSNLNGAGTLTKTDHGTLVLSGNSNLSGGTTVRAGRLVVNGTLLGDIDVLGGALGGSGTVGNLALSSGSVLRPGNSIGTLNVAGDIDFAAGSTYQVEVNAAGQSDLVVAGGTAIIIGADVEVLAEAGAYAPHTQYTILTAAGGRTGTFGSVTTNFAFLDPSLSYDANNVYLALTRNGLTFGNVGNTPNQVATGAGVDGLGAGNALYDAVLTLSGAEARRAFDLLSGEIHASARSVLIDDSRFIRNAINNRLAFASDDAAEAGSGIWGHAYGAWGHIKSDGNAAGVDHASGGFFVGADTMVLDAWKLGAVAGYGQTSIGVSDRASTAVSNNAHVGLYGGTEWEDIAFRTGAAYTWHGISTSRDTSFRGFSDTLDGAYGGATAQIFGELAYGIDVNAVRFEPFANFAYVNLRTDSFSEAGGAAALTGASASKDAAFVTLGVRASSSFELGGAMVTAKGMVGWQHAAAGGASRTIHSFGAGSAFGITGAPITQNAVVLEAGVDLALSPAATLGVNYAGHIGASHQSHALKGAFKLSF